MNKHTILSLIQNHGTPDTLRLRNGTLLEMYREAPREHLVKGEMGYVDSSLMRVSHDFSKPDQQLTTSLVELLEADEIIGVGYYRHNFKEAPDETNP